MSTLELSELHPVFAKQLQYTMTRDWDGLKSLYHPDIKSMRVQGVVEGRDAVVALLERYIDLNPEFVELNEYTHTDDMILTRSTLRIAGEEVVAFGAYVIKDGMIWRQFGCDEGGMRDWFGDAAQA